MNKLYLTSRHLRENHPLVYEALTNYVNDELRTAEIDGCNPPVEIEIDLTDCYIDENQNFFVPQFYRLLYQGTNDTDDRDVYVPVYNISQPTLTRLQVAGLIAKIDSPEINDPARNI